MYFSFILIYLFIINSFSFSNNTGADAELTAVIFSHLTAKLNYAALKRSKYSLNIDMWVT